MAATKPPMAKVTIRAWPGAHIEVKRPDGSFVWNGGADGTGEVRLPMFVGIEYRVLARGVTTGEAGSAETV